MENNTHLGEKKEKRLERFQGADIEFIETLINSIANYFNNEIRTTLDSSENPQTSLMILGVHSVALTVAFGFFNNDKEKGYKLFLENFVDGDTSDTRFSNIASKIHNWRNVIAHRWLSPAGFHFGYNFEMEEGWKKKGGVMFINPKIYLQYYLKAFGPKGKIYRYTNILDTSQKLKEAKERFLTQYKE